MAKNRMVNTKFWSDPFIVDELNPLDRYLFLYLLTNEKTTNIWIYEISIRTMCFETGIEKDTLLKMLDRLNDKMLYIDGWICLKNFCIHQSPNKNMLTWMRRVWEKEIPLTLKEKLKPFANHFKGLVNDSLLNLTKPNLTKPNSKEGKINSELVVPDVTTQSEPIWEIVDIFKSITHEEVLKKYNITQEEFDEEYIKFIWHWKSPIQSWKNKWKELWTTKPTFVPNLRFATWLSNNKKWSTKKETPAEIQKRQKLEELKKRRENLFNKPTANA